MPAELGRRALGPQQPRARQLLPASSGPAARLLITGCAALVVFLGIRYRHGVRAGRFDRVVDFRVWAGLRGYAPVLGLVHLGDPLPVALLVVALLLVCGLTGRWRGALLVAGTVPCATALTELVFKPLVQRTYLGALCFPSGHATAVFSLAASSVILLVGPGPWQLPFVVRTLLAVAVVATAALTAAAIVAVHSHYATDTVAGAAVATAVALFVACMLDRIELPFRLS